MEMLERLPWDWSFDPSVLIGLALAALLYAWGTRYSLKMGLSHHQSRWRWLFFALGLLTIFLALESPLDAWAETYQTAHMAQHILLIFAAPPLLLWGAPLMPVWRAIPLPARRSSLRWLMLHPRPRRVVLTVGRFFGQPRTIWWLFVVDFIAWHLPILYDLTLANQYVHDTEHLLFLGTSLLFWSQAIPSPPLHPRMGYASQAWYIFGAGLAMQIIPLMLTLSNTPFYAPYAAIHRPPGMPSVIEDQTAAGALMNLVGATVFGGTFMLLLWRWIDDEEHRQQAREMEWKMPIHSG